ncbi:MAG: hypothetical protein KJO69_06730 [Gammaproteobacteria bacterium]|nr:hypothetical protein [Gammaproteobacteria bacterium]
MIKSEFSIVNKIHLDKDFVSYDADPEDLFDVVFCGDKVLMIKGIDPSEVYGRLLICWTEQVQSLFIILKNNKIHNLSDSKIPMLKYVSEHAHMFKEFTDINDIIIFSTL